LWRQEPRAKDHGPGEHEYEKGVQLLKQCLDTSPNAPRIKTEVYLEGWPQNATVLEDAATILFYCDGSDRDEKAHPLLTDNRLETIGRLMKRGVGLMAIHYAVFVPSKRGGEQFLDWIGGYFDYENGSTPNKWFSKIETKTYRVMPSSTDHALTRGVKPFDVREEFYFNMRTRNQDAHWKPVLTFAPERADSTAAVAWSIDA
jgi:phage terminase large subunit-like protein